MRIRIALTMAVAMLTCATPADSQTADRSGWLFATQLPKGEGELISVCLYRDSKTARFLSPGEWRAKIGEMTPGCERLRVDLRKRLIALDMPNLTTERASGAGAIRAYCGGKIDREIYSPCTSAFFSTDPGYFPGFVALSISTLQKAALDASLNTILSQQVALLDEQLELSATRKKHEAQLTYESDFQRATTLAQMHGFEDLYANNDPQYLIPKMKMREIELERTEFSAAKTSAEWKLFIEKYKFSDLATLLDEAKRKLSQQLDRDAKADEIAAKPQRIQSTEDQIRFCKRSIAAAYQAIARERKVGALSGYENTQVMHQAAEMIVSCETSLPTTYKRYRELGGTKPYAVIR